MIAGKPVFGYWLMRYRSRRAIRKWFRVDGDHNLRLQYDLRPDSLVFDVGGYQGEWADGIFSRYSCRVFVFEPLPSHNHGIRERFQHVREIAVFPFGLAGETRRRALTDDAERSSTRITMGLHVVDADFVDILEFVRTHQIKAIDLIKINIEGDEYELLPRMIDTGIAQLCTDIQVQFHLIDAGAVAARRRIRAQLRKTHALTYDFPFVWENWRRLPRE